MGDNTNIKTEKPLLSFVMPVYNDGGSVTKAIESIFDQDWPVEVIAVNDGSPDNAKEVLDGLKEKYPNLTVVHFKENKGACIARNGGAKLAKGKYIAWLPADAKLYPGMARIWVQTLEANPDKDFLYGGYRFVDENGQNPMDYMGDVFDPYMLEVSNYIDGSFPMRMETYKRIAGEIGADGLWDSEIVSLQDWDFWLTVVKHGGQGLYYRDVFFETTYPHPGGLSYDSHKNWLSRTKAIKTKHGIPDRKICVTSPGAPFFGKYIAKILNADFKEAPQLKAHDYHLIYELGFYPSIAQHCAAVFVDPIHYPAMQEFAKNKQDVPLAPCTKVVHLIGTDLLQMSDSPKAYMDVFKFFLNQKYDHVFTEFDETQKEAKELGLVTKILPLPPREYFEPTEFPEKFTVAVYAPSVNQQLYNVDAMVQVAKELPDVKFLFFGDKDKKGVDGNIEYCGYVKDMASFIKRCSCLVRITMHDGLPQSVLEFLSAGRRVIFNHEFKYVNLASRSLSTKIIARAIRQEMKEGLNLEASKWIRENFTQEKFKEHIESLLTYDAKGYWERRADGWLLQSKLFYNTKDWEHVEPYVKEIAPESVIDIGCGDGQWAELFDQEYLGVDISQKLVDAAKERFPDKDFKCSSVVDLETDKKYDIAFCYTLFMHVPERDMEQAVNALKKCAKRAILVEPTGIVTRYYQHNHDYEKWFTIEKKEKIGDRTLMVVRL